MKQDYNRMQWHQLDLMHITRTFLQTDNHASTASLNFFAGRMFFLMPNQQCQSTEGQVILQVCLKFF